MKKVQSLIREIAKARNEYIAQIINFTEAEAEWKPTPEVWNMVENTEHLFWAEQGGILGMWKTLNAIRDGKMERSYESVHKEMHIEQIIQLTWQPKEKVPAVAAPKYGGPLSFWLASLSGLQTILESFGHDIKDEELRLQAHPHPISGPMDFQQRFEFLRFHINRHKEQVARLINELKMQK
jgi:hypothetical protein